MSKITEQLKKFSEYSVEDQERILDIASIAIRGYVEDGGKLLPDYADVLRSVKPELRLLRGGYVGTDAFRVREDEIEANSMNLPTEGDASFLFSVVQEINVAEYIYQKYNYTERPPGIGLCYHIGMRENKEVAVSAWLAAYSGNPRFYEKEHCQEAIDILLNIDPEWGIKRFKA